MKPSKAPVSLLVVLSIGMIAAGCSTGSTKSPDVADRVRKDLDQVHIGDVSVSQDREKGDVTLTRHVGSDADNLQAEAMAKPDACGPVVHDQVAVVPPVGDNNAKAANSDL